MNADTTSDETRTASAEDVLFGNADHAGQVAAGTASAHHVLFGEAEEAGDTLWEDA